ncbi:MAG: hypothetical protein FJ026_00370 [Chloroflexi bacterium]|nr:hypothetical protein [Chloroflexota bacterium]
MAKVTYFEYRPGRWVKMVDGQAVGPAKPEEVAQWQREQAAHDNIWQDVVQKAAPSQPEREAPPKSRAPLARPEDEAAIWQDVVKKAETAPKGDKAKPATAEPGGIWQDVVQRLASAPSPPKLQPQEVPPAKKPATEEPAAPLTLAEAMEVARRGKPVVIRAGKVETRGEKAAAPVQPAAVEPLKETLDQPKIEPMPKRPSQPEPTPPATPPEPTPEAKAPAKESAVKPAAKATPKAKAAAEDVTPKAVARPRPTPKPAGPAPGGKATATKERAKPPAGPAPQERRAQPRIRPTPAKTTAEAEPAAETAGLEQEAAFDRAPPAARARPAAKPRASTAARRATKPPAIAPEEAVRPAHDGEINPSYLWIVAAPTDDLLDAIRSGLARYRERFGEAAGAVLCHAADLPGLEGARLPVEVREGKTLPRRNFWIGPK